MKKEERSTTRTSPWPLTVFTLQQMQAGKSQSKIIGIKFKSLHHASFFVSVYFGKQFGFPPKILISPGRPQGMKFFGSPTAPSSSSVPLC